MTELISIITPAYQAQSCIVNAVCSVLAQSHSHWEMLIVADDEQDYRHILQTHDIEDERLRFFRTPSPCSGPNVARNLALKKARGQWIAPLDADDCYYPERLHTLLRIAHTSGLALDNVNIVGEGLAPRSVLAEVDIHAFGFDEFQRSLVPLLFLFHRRHIPCGWDEDIVRGADTLFNLRALESAGYAAYIPQALHEYRVHDQSMCHAEGAADIFREAYHHTLHRLRGDGLGFRSDSFRADVIAMIEEKQRINVAFARALERGFNGTYQHFVETDYAREGAN